MEKPEIFKKEPARIELEAGTYYWCRCGRSANQPFCDGSHKVTTLLPEKFELTEKKLVALCLCKQTSKPPFCDGTHRTL